MMLAMANDSVREELENAVTTAVLDLFAYTGTTSLKLPIKGTTPTVYVVSGDESGIRKVMRTPLVRSTRNPYREWVASHPPIV